MKIPNQTYEQYSLLRTIPASFWEEASKKSFSLREKTYEKGEIIHFHGDFCTGIDIILEGQVVIERIDETGNLMVITTFYQDDMLGGNLLFSHSPYYPMLITAKTPVTLLPLPKDLVFTCCAENRAFLEVYLSYISDHSLVLGDTIKHVLNRSIREQLISFIQKEYREQKSYTLQLPVTKKALADTLGVQRTSVSRELQKMKKEGLLEYDAKSIHILSPELLK